MRITLALTIITFSLSLHGMENKLLTINHWNNDQWNVLPRHDGTYSMVPNTGHELHMWQESNTNRKSSIIAEKNKTCVLELISPKNNDEISQKLAAIHSNNLAERNKKFIFLQEDKDNTTVIPFIVPDPVSHCLFSNDNALLLFCCSKSINHGTMQIYNTKTEKRYGCRLNSSTSALCAAHHSPFFAIGTNNPQGAEFSNLFLLINHENIQHLKGHNASITHVEFSPDDTRLLTCSYNEKTNVSTLCLWDTSNVNKIVRVSTFEHFARHKAFFMCNGERIKVTREVDDIFCLLDGLTGDSIKKNKELTFKHHCCTGDTIAPHHDMTIWSSKNKLMICSFGRKILFYSSETGKYLGSESYDNTITGIGLTADEDTIVYVDENENVYTLPLYEDGQVKVFLPAIKSYIQEQQKKSEIITTETKELLS